MSFFIPKLCVFHNDFAVALSVMGKCVDGSVGDMVSVSSSFLSSPLRIIVVVIAIMHHHHHLHPYTHLNHHPCASS